MTARQPRVPHLWLMTDERIPDLITAVKCLPRGSGVVFRHHTTPGPERRALFGEIRAITRRRRCILFLAAPPARAWQWGADGAFDRSLLASRGLRGVGVHNGAELALARRICADLIFVSPVYPTRSHPGQPALGIIRAGKLAGHSRARAIALGGMTQRRALGLRALGFFGWAAIDGLSPMPRQKRKAVPT